MRVFVFERTTSTKAIAVLDCQSLDAEKAIVPGHVSLASLKPKMVLRPANDEGKPDMEAMALLIGSINQGTEGAPSTIHFQKQSSSRASKSPAASKKKEEDQSE